MKLTKKNDTGVCRMSMLSERTLKKVRNEERKPLNSPIHRGAESRVFLLKLFLISLALIFCLSTLTNIMTAESIDDPICLYIYPKKNNIFINKYKKDIDLKTHYNLNNTFHQTVLFIIYGIICNGRKSYLGSFNKFIL